MVVSCCILLLCCFAHVLKESSYSFLTKDLSLVIQDFIYEIKSIGLQVKISIKFYCIM